MIKSHLLYQLSYAPGTGPESLRKRASFSKATPAMSSKPAGVFPAMTRLPRNGEKAAGIRRLLLSLRSSRQTCAVRAARDRPGRRDPGRRHPVETAAPVVATIPVAAATIAIHAALEPAVPPAFAAAKPVLHDGSGWRAGASGRHRGSCRAGRPHPRSSSSPPPWSPCCRRGRAGAPPDRRSSDHPASADRSCCAFIRALARSIRIFAKSRTAVSTGGHSFS